VGELFGDYSDSSTFRRMEVWAGRDPAQKESGGEEKGSYWVGFAADGSEDLGVVPYVWLFSGRGREEAKIIVIRKVGGLARGKRGRGGGAKGGGRKLVLVVDRDFRWGEALGPKNKQLRGAR